MTPKEKSAELVNNFIKIESLKDFEGMYLELAKECAFVTVNEILLSLEGYSSITYLKRKNYWNEVKKEIENI